MSDQEILDLEKIGKKDVLVAKLLAEYQSFKEDPAKVFYLQITEVIKAMSKDMGIILDGNNEPTTLIRGDKDNKQFDQVKVLLLDAETIFKGLKFARENIMPELKEKQDKEESQEGLSSVDRLANNKKQKQ